MAVGIALLGMLIQFAINKDRDEEEESEDEDEPYEEERSRKKKEHIGKQKPRFRICTG